MTWLIEAQIFRPSYSWMLASAKKFPTDGFLTNGGPDLDAMRSLRAYSEVLHGYRATPEGRSRTRHGWSGKTDRADQR